MINDGTIKEIVARLEADGLLDFDIRDDYGYKIKYRSTPTIVSTLTDTFTLNGVSTIDKIHGQHYVDRVHIAKDANKAEVRAILVAMLEAFRNNPIMKELDTQLLSFQMPGYGQRFLREIESNPNVFELRLFAKGYPKND